MKCIASPRANRFLYRTGRKGGSDCQSSSCIQLLFVGRFTDHPANRVYCNSRTQPTILLPSTECCLLKVTSNISVKFKYYLTLKLTIKDEVFDNARISICFPIRQIVSLILASLKHKLANVCAFNAHSLRTCGCGVTPANVTCVIEAAVVDLSLRGRSSIYI